LNAHFSFSLHSIPCTPATEKKLNALQQWFARLVLQVGPGAPLAALGWELGLTDMKLRVWKEKVMLILHIRGLAEETLANQVYRQQVEMDWPGLARETKEICALLGIEDCNSTNMSRKEFKSILDAAINKKDEEILRQMADGKQKCSKIMNEKYGKKDYTSKEHVSDVRKWFRTRVGLLPFAGNYSRDQQYARTEWMCRCEGEREEESHLLAGKCPVYNDINGKYEALDNDHQLVSFFQEILERRDLIDLLDEEDDCEAEEERGDGPGGGPSPLMSASPRAS
jgi:hypothetical protein